MVRWGSAQAWKLAYRPGPNQWVTCPGIGIAASPKLRLGLRARAWADKQLPSEGGDRPPTQALPQQLDSIFHSHAMADMSSSTGCWSPRRWKRVDSGPGPLYQHKCQISIHDLCFYNFRWLSSVFQFEGSPLLPPFRESFS